MTPKEKAKELVDKFIFIDNGERFQIISITDELRAIQCALIAVNHSYSANKRTYLKMLCLTIKSRCLYNFR